MVWAPPGASQHEEEPEDVHQRSHAHVHLAQVDEDHHQHEGVQRQMMKLKVVVLQQHPKEGGSQERELDQGIGGEENNFTAL
jgi:hypothetical protein